MNLSIFASRIKDLRSQNNLTLENICHGMQKGEGFG
jgi:hypothetical protein